MRSAAQKAWARRKNRYIHANYLKKYHVDRLVQSISIWYMCLSCERDIFVTTNVWIAYECDAANQLKLELAPLSTLFHFWAFN